MTQTSSSRQTLETHGDALSRPRHDLSMSGFISQILKALVPGSPGFLVLALAVGLAAMWKWRRVRWWSLAWLATVVVMYLLLSLPWTANRLADALPRYPPLLRAADAGGASALVVFDGDNREHRIIETVRVYRLLHPKQVIVAGDREFRRLVVEEGVPAAVVLWENRSRTTREQALAVARLLQEHGINRIVLVASPLHMPRALAAVRAVGIDAVPSASRRPYPNLPRTGRRSVMPRPSALDLSYDALYEHMALAYYRHQGWMAK